MGIKTKTLLLTLLVAVALAPYGLYELLLNDVATRPITVQIDAPELTQAEAQAISVERLQLQASREELAPTGSLAWHDQTGLARQLFIIGSDDVLSSVRRVDVHIGASVFSLAPEQFQASTDSGETTWTVPSYVRLETVPVPRAGELINVRFSLIGTVLLGLTAVLFAAPLLILRPKPLADAVMTAAFAASVLASTAWLIPFPAIVWLLLVYAGAGWAIIVIEHWRSPEERASLAAEGTAPEMRSAVAGAALAVTVFAVLGFQFWNLGVDTMWTDEFFSFHAARMIQEKGEPVFPTGRYYGRAQVYHRLLAATMSTFGNNELGGRIPNLLFNAITMMTIYAFLRRENRLVAVLAAATWGFSSLALEMTRLVRMYAMFTAVFTATAYALYRAVVNPVNGRGLTRIPGVGIPVHIPWAVMFVLFFLLSVDTQRLTIMLVFGLVLFGGWRILHSRHDRVGWFLFAGSLFVLFAAAYREYGTFNIIAAYYELSTPFHARDARFRPWHYTDLFAANLPLFLWLLYLAPFWSRTGKPTVLHFAVAVLLGGLVFLIPQSFRVDRFAYALMPFAIIVAVWLVFSFVLHIRERKSLVRVAGALAVVLAASHIGVFAHEHRSVLVAEDRNRYEPVFRYLQTVDLESATLVADWDAVFTLASRDVYAEYILLPPDHERLQRGERRDSYIGLPLIPIGGETYKELLDSPDTVFVITRDGTKGVLAREAYELPGFTHPKVYRSVHERR